MAVESSDNRFDVVGKEFENLEIFEKEFRNYCNSSYQPLVIITNNKRQVTIQCRHGYKRASESTGQRVNLHYNYIGCQAKITCYKPTKSTSVRITSIILQHNHVISKAAFESTYVQLNEIEKEVITDLREANCKISQICRVMHSKFDKKLSSQKMKNIIRQLVPSSDDDSSQLENFLEEVEREGGIISVKYDANGDVSALFISSGPMKDAYLQAASTITQVDTSFNFDTSKYKLCGFCYLNPTTNCSEFCALAFLSEETAVNLRFIFQCFKKMCSKPPKIFIVDKDFNEIAVLKEVFRKATIFLCNFHVIKYVKNLIATALITVESKKNLMTNFKAMMYAKTEEIYDENKNHFLTSIKDVQVRVNKNYVFLENQFLNNWDSCKEMWVTFYRKALPTLGDNTNNRIERSFWTLKQSIEARFPSLPVIQRSVIHLVSFCEERIIRAASQASLKTLRIYDSDAVISTLNQESALHLNERGCILFYKSLKALQERRNHMNIIDETVLESYDHGESTYNCSFTECTCTFYCNNQSPCRHILFKREHDPQFQNSIFSLSLFHIRYHRKTNNISNNTILSPQKSVKEIDTENFESVSNASNANFEFPDEEFSSNSDSTEKILNNREKYNLILPFLLNIATLSSCHGTQQFLSYLSAAKEFEKSVKTGSDVNFAVPKQVYSQTKGDLEEMLPLQTASEIPIENFTMTNSRKFGNLQFRDKVQIRGRPKRPVRQLCTFNKTSADRQVKEKKNSRGKKRLHSEERLKEPAVVASNNSPQDVIETQKKN